MNYLTKHQIERQDFVDNAIFNLIKSVNPSAKEISWDIEMIGKVRDVLNEWLVYRLNLTEEQEFYPYKEE